MWRMLGYVVTFPRFEPSDYPAISSVSLESANTRKYESKLPLSFKLSLGYLQTSA